VIKMLSPARMPEFAGGSSRLSASFTGSHMRPSPTSPQAWLPDAGPRMRMPREIRVSTLACVALLAHITRIHRRREHDRRFGGEAQGGPINRRLARRPTVQ